jgi:hypothetical protein
MGIFLSRAQVADSAWTGRVDCVADRPISIFVAFPATPSANPPHHGTLLSRRNCGLRAHGNVPSSRTQQPWRPVLCLNPGASAWLLTAGIAFVSVRNGNISLHRQWMARSYAITTVFLTNRIFAAIPAIDRAQNRPGGMVVHVGMEWSILVASLVLTDLGLAWSGIFTNKRVAK